MACPWLCALIAAGGVAAGAEAPAPAPPATPSPSPAALDDLVVSAEKLFVENLIDRKVYSVANDLQSTFGSLADILNVIPSVDVDPDGVVSLRGDSNVLILIDGRPSTQFSGSSAGDNLQSIPAKDIERIEILTTPPAEFKADGVAGVINIITRKHRPEGTDGSLQGSLGSGGRSVLGADVSHHAGGLTVSGTSGYRQDLRQRLISSSLIAPDPATGSTDISNSIIAEKIRRETPTAGLTLAWALNDRQILNASASWADRGGLRTYTENDDSRTGAGMVTGVSRRLSSGHDPETDLDEKLGFTQTLGSPGETLELSVHRSTSRQHEHYDYIDESFVPPLATSLSNLSFHEDHATSEFGADYTRPLPGERSVKAGYAFEQDDFGYGNLGETIDPATGLPVALPALTNEFRFRQQIHALYASYRAARDSWSWLLGARGEYTLTHAELVTDDRVDDHRYTRLYPSVHVDDALSDTSTLSFAASRRVTRPDPGNLDPFVDHEYTPNLRAGNPDLKPQYAQVFEVGYGFEGHGRSDAVTGYYRLNRDKATDITSNLGNGLSLTTTVNLPRSKLSGLEFSATGHLLPTLAYSVSGNLFYSQIDATALGAQGLRSTAGLNAKTKLDYRPTELDSAQLTLTRTGKRLTPQGSVDAMNLVNAGYKRRLTPDWSAVVTLSDLFDGQRFERFAATPTFTQDYRRTVRGRVLYLGFVHAFGGSGKKDKSASFDYDAPG